MNLPIYKLKINEDDFETGIDFISLVENPAIQKDFLAFNQQFVQPGPTENQDEFIARCVKYVIDEGKDSEQAVAICYSLWENRDFEEGDKVSFDFDDTLNTEKGKKLAEEEIQSGSTVYIISARHDKASMYSVADEVGIPHSRIYAMGSNSAKVQEVKKLGITRHYDNNADVISQLVGIGEKFDIVALLPNYVKQLKKLKTKTFESYTDYPQAAMENAKRGIKLNDENNNKCATQVGKVRAQQIANGEPLSQETIQRTFSYLSRAKAYYNPNDDSACGTISYLLWGGDEMLNWCERKLNSFKKTFAIQNEEKRIITGAAMLADLPIYRRDEIRGEYYVVFDRETIFQIAKKWAVKNKYNSVNVDHSQVINGMTLLETYFIDRERGIVPPIGFEDAKDGSWFVTYYVQNDQVWNEIKQGTWKGFSVEGFFDFVEPQSQEDEMLSQLMNILKKWDGK